MRILTFAAMSRGTAARYVAKRPLFSCAVKREVRSGQDVRTFSSAIKDSRFEMPELVKTKDTDSLAVQHRTKLYNAGFMHGFSIGRSESKLLFKRAREDVRLPTKNYRPLVRKARKTSLNYFYTLGSNHGRSIAHEDAKRSNESFVEFIERGWKHHPYMITLHALFNPGYISLPFIWWVCADLRSEEDIVYRKSRQRIVKGASMKIVKHSNQSKPL